MAWEVLLNMRKNFIYEVMILIDNVRYQYGFRASDEVFLRRATLDATDVIPTAEETRAFLADPTPDKRDRLPVMETVL